MVMLIYALLMAGSSAYFIFFIFVALWPIEMISFKSLVLYEISWLPFVVLGILILSTFKIGCYHVKDIAALNKQNCLAEVEQKQALILNFIGLARRLLREEGEAIIQKFTDDIIKRYDLKEGDDARKG